MDKDEVIKKLLEILSFYADEDNYIGYIDPDYLWSGEEKEYPSPVDYDEGKLARDVIDEINPETPKEEPVIERWD